MTTEYTDGTDIQLHRSNNSMTGVFSWSFSSRSGFNSFRTAIAAPGKCSLNASSGDITLRLGANAAFDLAAHASSGSIDLNHPVTVMGKISKKEIRGKVRGGGALIDVHTSSGDIRIE